MADGFQETENEIKIPGLGEDQSNKAASSFKVPTAGVFDIKLQHLGRLPSTCHCSSKAA